MLTNQIEYRGFIKLYDKTVNKLANTANILPISSTEKVLINTPVEISTLWDTGATLTFMKPKIRDRLKLRMFRTGSPINIAGIGGLIKADFTFVSILLAPNFVIGYCPVYVADFPVNTDMVIGMDIINMGDFVINNIENKTSFSFVIPPLPDRINFVNIANALNNQKR